MLQKNISQFNKGELCSGCGACASICPRGAIKMEQAANGFLYPVVDKMLCISCGLCVKSCDFKSFHPTGNCPVSYAARHKDVDELMSSRSGGFFMAVCNYVISSWGGG